MAFVVGVKTSCDTGKPDKNYGWITDNCQNAIRRRSNCVEQIKFWMATIANHSVNAKIDCTYYSNTKDK